MGLTVLAHELVKLDIVRVPPPLFPFRGVVGRDGGVADRRVELINDEMRIPEGKNAQNCLPRRLLEFCVSEISQVA